MKRIAVIGAGGFVGGALLDFLTRAGDTCIAVGRSDALPAEPVDVVIDCNGEGRRFWSNENPAESYRRSVETVQTRLADIEAETYVYLSTVDVYGEGRAHRKSSSEDATINVEALDTYGSHKRQAEELVLERAPRALVLRCGTLIGPGLRKNPVYDLLHGIPLRMTAQSTVSLVHTDTLGHAIRTLMAARVSGIFNVASSQSIGIAAMREMIARARGVDAASMPMHENLISTYYDVNIEKISAWMTIPTSENALAGFLQGDTAA